MDGEFSSFALFAEVQKDIKEIEIYTFTQKLYVNGRFVSFQLTKRKD